MRTTALALFLLAVSGPQAAPAQPAPGAPAAPDVMELKLGLADAIARGIENNLGVAIARFDPAAADYDLDAAWGLHDPLVTGNFTHQSTDTPVASALQRSSTLFERVNRGGVGLVGLVPRLGWTYEFGYSGVGTTSTSSIQSLSTEFRANLTSKLTVPLLKGFLWGKEWTQVRTAGIGRGIARDEFRTALMDTVQGIARAYWNHAARKLDYEVGEKSLETARALLEQTRAQYEVGVVSRVEVVEAEAGVADREFRLISAENTYRTAQDQLIDAVFGTRLRPTTRVELTETDDPDRVEAYQVDEGVAAEKAFALRPELAVARERVAQQELQVKFALNQRLPRLDLVGSYGYQGLAGIPNPNPLFGIPLPKGAVPRDYSDTSDFFFKGRNNVDWSGGAVFSIPLGNSSARANHRKSQVLLRQLQTQALRTEQTIILEVRKAVRDLRSAIQGIEAANRRLEAANEQLRAEQIRLEHGESTPFEVLQREEDLVEAESQKIGALQIYHDSVADLERAQGTILRDRGIVIEDALSLR